MDLLTPNTIQTLIYIVGFLALTFILIYIAFEGSGDEEEDDEGRSK